MRVLLVSRDCQVGGVEAFTVSLALSLRARGAESELFFLERGPMEQHLPAGLPARFGDLGDCLKYASDGRFDVVHCHSSDWDHGVAALRRAGAKLVVTSHGWVVKDWDSTNCDGIACCSEWQSREQRLYTDLPVRTILNGIDAETFRPAEDEASAGAAGPPIVAWVGRGTALVQKRIDRLAAAAPLLARAGARLWIADPYGPEEVGRVAPEAAAVLREAAEFWGGVARERMADFYREVAASGGCVLSTASFEGLPLALAEAQACGCPVVASDVRGNDEVVRPEHGGLLYPPDDDPEAVAALVLKMIGDGEGMRRRRAECSRFARGRFGLERMTGDYLDFYREVLAAAPPRRRASPAPALLGWNDYVGRRWRAGRSQYEASRKLAAEGERELASEAARASLATCPTIYARPSRLAYLLRVLLAPARRAQSPE